MPARSYRCAWLLSLCSVALTAGAAHAGAWLQPEGRGQIILNGYYYTADEFFNNQGQRRSQPDYVKYELNPYLEYGLTDTLTVGTNLSLQRAAQDIATGGQNTNFSLGDSEFFLRAPLWQEGNWMVSASPMIKLPSPESSNSVPKIGGTHPDAGLGISAGYGFGEGNSHHFANLDTMYRYRFGDPKDQINIAATLGWDLSPEWVLMPQIFLTYRVKSPQAATFTQSSGDDYNLVKLQLSAVYRWDASTSLQFGGFGDVDGKNTGVGRGTLFSLWRKF